MKKAFTLIEILIVVILLGILAAVVIPQFVDQTASVNKGAAKSDLGTLNSAWQQYVASTLANGTTPGVPATYDAAITVLTTGKYLDKAPTPPTGYTYGISAGAATAQEMKFTGNPDPFAD